MKLFSFTRSIAIDLGTANTIIMEDDQVVVDQPSVVAIRTKDDATMAVGTKASAMIDRGEQRIRTIRPLKEGVIADYKACEKMIRGLIDMMPKRSRIFAPAVRMVGVAYIRHHFCHNGCHYAYNCPASTKVMTRSMMRSLSAPS